MTNRERLNRTLSLMLLESNGLGPRGRIRASDPGLAAG
jgi:hypothetical protein